MRAKTLTTTLMATLLLVPCAAQATKPDVSPGPAKPVVVQNTDPIPVVGDVTATVVGVVPVTVENVLPIPIEGPVTIVNPSPIAVEGPVTVVNPNPIPVTGDVSATISGPVQVENFEAKIDELKSEVAQVRAAVEALSSPTPANFAKTWIGNFDTYAYIELPQTVLVSMITISAENDNLEVAFCDSAPTASDCAPGDHSIPKVLQLGNNNATFPRVLALPLPQPLGIRAFNLTCWNSVEQCETTITIIGTVAP